MRYTPSRDLSRDPRTAQKTVVGAVFAAVLALAFVMAVVTAPGVPGAGGSTVTGTPSAAGAAQDAPGLAWNKTIGGSNNDRFNAVIRSVDGGYVAGGRFGQTQTEFGKAWLVKFNANGDVVWNRTYASGAFQGVIRTADGGYLAVGKQPSDESSESVALAVKVNANGSVKWSKTYGKLAGAAFFDDAANTDTGGYIFLGGSYVGPQRSENVNASNGYFVKVDVDGNTLWEKGYGTMSADSASAIHRTDGTHRFFGDFAWGTSKWAGSLASNGNLLKNRSIGNPDEYSSTTGSVETSDGYAVIGHSGGLIGGKRLHLITMDHDLNIRLNRTIAVPSTVTSGEMAVTADGGYAVALGNWSKTLENDTTGDISITATGAVLKIAPDGTKQWLESYGASEASLATDVAASGNGGIVVVGTGLSGSGKGADGWIAKTDSDGTDENGGSTGTEIPTMTETTEPAETTESTNTPTDSAATIESMCKVADSVEGLSVVGCQSEIKSEDLFITVTVRNDGNQVADLYDHHLDATVYKSTETTGFGVTGGVVVSHPGDTEVPPGETGKVSIRVSPNPDVSAEDIQRYVVELSCEFGADGVYCG